MTSTRPRGFWVTTEDQYDRDRNRIGPFPTAEAAAAWCDAYNAAQIKIPAGTAGASYSAAAAIGVWNLASCEGYDVAARLDVLYQARLRAPEAPRPDADTIAQRHGARWEVDWIVAERAAIGAPICWCASLLAGQVPEVASDVLDAYLALGLEHGKTLFTTPQHDGRASLARCRPCGGAIFCLLVEYEGLSGSIHRYYAPASPDVAAAITAGKLDAGSFEAWLGLRAGIHAAGTAVCCHGGAVVGHIGIDHRLR